MIYFLKDNYLLNLIQITMWHSFKVSNRNQQRTLAENEVI